MWMFIVYNQFKYCNLEFKSFLDDRIGLLLTLLFIKSVHSVSVLGSNIKFLAFLNHLGVINIVQKSYIPF